MPRKPDHPLDPSEFGDPSFRELIEAPEPPTLYMPNQDGTPKFWVKLEPRVYLVGHTALEYGEHPDFPGLMQFFEDEEIPFYPPEHLAEAKDKGVLSETAGRLCYYSFKKPRPGGHDAYMRRIIEEGHGSVLEHAHFNFIITGVSRTFSHELVRHRLASYSQLSQRYFEEVACSFVCPPETARNPSWFARWLGTMETCYDNYVDQVMSMRQATTYLGTRRSSFLDLESRDLHKAILGEARSQLPNATETKLMFSLNARALRGVLDQRADTPADQEIRRVAVKMYELAMLEFPSAFRDYERREVPGYGKSLKTPYRKV